MPITINTFGDLILLDAGTGVASQPTESPTTLSARVQDFKDRTGLTWSQVAALFGVSRRAVHHWVEGGNMSALNIGRLNQLSTRLSTSLHLDAAAIRPWLFAPDGNGQSRYADWATEVSSRGPDDGRTLADQLDLNAPPVHIPEPGKRLHRLRTRLDPG